MVWVAPLNGSRMSHKIAPHNMEEDAP
jgi:hypothetical protein